MTPVAITAAMFAAAACGCCPSTPPAKPPLLVEGGGSRPSCPRSSASLRAAHAAPEAEPNRRFPRTWRRQGRFGCQRRGTCEQRCTQGAQIWGSCDRAVRGPRVRRARAVRTRPGRPAASPPREGEGRNFACKNRHLRCTWWPFRVRQIRRSERGAAADVTGPLKKWSRSPGWGSWSHTPASRSPGRRTPLRPPLRAVTIHQTAGVRPESTTLAADKTGRRGGDPRGQGGARS